MDPDILHEHLLVDTMIQTGGISLQWYTTCHGALQKAHGIPGDIRVLIIAFALPRVLRMSPYTNHNMYCSESMLRDNVLRAKGGFEENVISAASPIHLHLGEAFCMTTCGGSSAYHCGGIGLVTKAWRAAKQNLRFSKEALVLYPGIEIMSQDKPEMFISAPEGAYSKCIWLSFHGDFVAFWFEVDPSTDHARASYVVPVPERMRGQFLFPAIQAWNHGVIKMAPSLVTVKRVPRAPRDSSDHTGWSKR